MRPAIFLFCLFMMLIMLLGLKDFGGENLKMVC